MPRGPHRLGTPKKSKHRLSLAMMVKNEAANLEKCLRLARPYVDELVVVDTGSTDGTQEIAQRYADVYDEIEWPGSFAEARNYTFDKATGDYILVLDGDEYLEKPSHWNRLRKAIRRSDLACILLPVRNLLQEGQIVTADCMWQERVMRNHPDLRYHGRVHHQIQDRIKDFAEAYGYKNIQVEAEIVHTGYALTAEQMIEKYRPRLPLLLAEYDEATDATYRAYYGFQLGVAYFVLKRFEECSTVLNAIDYGELTPHNAFYAHLLAAQAAIKLNEAAPALVHCNAMLSLNRREPVAYYATGLALLMARQVSDGMLMILEAYNVNDDAGVDTRFVLSPQHMVTRLAQICGGIGLADHAKLFEAMAAKGQHDPRVARHLIESIKTGLVRAERQQAAA